MGDRRPPNDSGRDEGLVGPGVTREEVARGTQVTRHESWSGGESRHEDHAGPASSREERVGGPAATTDERAAPSGGPAEEWVAVPPELKARFSEVVRLRVTSAEADLFRVRERDSGALRALKLYRPHIELDPEIVGRLQREADRAHVVDIFEVDQVREQWFEILEYVAEGTLRDLIDSEGHCLEQAIVEEVLVELATALTHLHQLSVWHLDLKPRNVLVRTRDPLDLVLADFGLATMSEHSGKHSAVKGTDLYNAPETVVGFVSAARDWWSLGVVVAEMLLGRHPLADVPSGQIRSYVARHPIGLDGIEDDRWRLLCQGLLARNDERRWKAEQIHAWLRGESPAVDIDSPSPHLASIGAMPFEVAGHRCDTEEQLARAIATSWEAARADLAQGNLHSMAQHRADYELARFLKSGETSGEPIDVQLVRLLARLDPSHDPVYRGYLLTERGLAGLADDAAEHPNGERAETLADLFEQDVLSVVGNDFDSAWHRELGAAWREQVDDFDRRVELAGRGGAETPDSNTIRQARAQLLLALLDDAIHARLTDQAARAATTEAKKQPWYRELAAVGSTSPGQPAELLAMQLFGTDAAAQTRTQQAEAERRRKEEKRRRQERKKRREREAQRREQQRREETRRREEERRQAKRRERQAQALRERRRVVIATGIAGGAILGAIPGWVVASRLVQAFSEELGIVGLAGNARTAAILTGMVMGLIATFAAWLFARGGFFPSTFGFAFGAGAVLFVAGFIVIGILDTWIFEHTGEVITFRGSGEVAWQSVARIKTALLTAPLVLGPGIIVMSIYWRVAFRLLHKTAGPND